MIMMVGNDNNLLEAAGAGAPGSAGPGTEGSLRRYKAAACPAGACRVGALHGPPELAGTRASSVNTGAGTEPGRFHSA